MNLLFLTLLDFKSLEDRNIYTDLLRQFRDNGHNVYVISPTERRKTVNEDIIIENNANILKVKIGNTQKTNVIRKGISTLTIEPIFINAIKRHFENVTFDLILYSTPPITFCNPIRYVKKRDNAFTYLLLKDIFPQNSVDLGMLKKHGISSALYKYFRIKEKNLYSISDKIGCMSLANVSYVLEHNNIDVNKVEICPNSVEPIDMSSTKQERLMLRNKYELPLDKKIFVYGGNLGKPQGIDFLITCLENIEIPDVFFLIVGDGTEYPKLEKFIKEKNPSNVRLLRRLEKSDYDKMIGSCDVGMIFLDYRFTIPNYPSRLLSYLQAGIPILSVTDRSTDIGNFIEENNVGEACLSNSYRQFLSKVQKMLKTDYDKNQIQRVLRENFNAQDSYEIIMRSFNENCCK